MRKPRPLSKQAADALRVQIGDKVDGEVWPCKNPPYKLLNKRKLRKEANWPHRWFHDFRKTAKMRFKVAAGKDVAKEMLGHQTDAMDDYYTHYQRKELEAAVKASYNPANLNDQTNDQQ